MITLPPDYLNYWVNKLKVKKATDLVFEMIEEGGKLIMKPIDFSKQKGEKIE